MTEDSAPLRTVDDQARTVKRWLVAVALVGTVVWLMSSGGNDDGDKADEYGAADVCHQAVEAQLKAPGTADFGGETTTNAGDRYTMRGYVDAENGFGAKIRVDWTCTATWVSGNNWSPVIATLSE